MEQFDFEKSLSELEKIVEGLENGDMPLEKSLELFEKGITLSKNCASYLENAKQRIITLTEAKNEETADD